MSRPTLNDVKILSLTKVYLSDIKKMGVPDYRLGQIEEIIMLYVFDEKYGHFLNVEE